MTKMIGLGKRGFVAIVDDEDYCWLAHYRWHLTGKAPLFYAYRQFTVNRTTRRILMHREILNAPRLLKVDHRDGNGLNNTRANLRLCSDSQNQGNRNMPASNTSGYKGVYWHKRSKKWDALIKFQGKKIHLGLHENKTDAALAYNEAAVRLFGEFARINHI